jgi:hypothetical protein
MCSIIPISATVTYATAPLSSSISVFGFKLNEQCGTLLNLGISIIRNRYDLCIIITKALKILCKTRLFPNAKN